MLATAALVSAPSALAEPSPDYTRDVRPILAEYCYPCHGPDGETRKSDLRLDIMAEAIDYGAVTPGDPSDSLLVERITTTDLDDIMPQPKFGRSLDAAQIDTLVRWIRDGATYERHWAFEPVLSAEAPAASEWARDPVDAFIEARLNEAGLAPSPEANRVTWLRRVTFDLTGLPPTLAEIDTFTADESPGAYETVVDRLLASPHYGERMAVDWLDAARYADTFGYQDDKPNEAWPWRDWVIAAFNRNLPYDEFITWQLAGDMLPNATQDQRLATAFNRLHRQSNEGGSIEEELRVEYANDRARTVGTAVMGLTLECAQCHDHKFDPISQREYYSFVSFFNNIDESGMYAHFTDAKPTPSMFLYNDGQETKHESLKAAMRDRELALSAVAGKSDDAFDAWLTDPSRSMPNPQPIVYVNFDDVNAEGVPVNIADAERAPKMGGVEIIDDPEHGRLASFSGENSITFEKVGSFERHQPFSVSIRIRAAEHVPQMVVWHASRAEIDAANRGYELLLMDGKPVVGLNHFWPGNAIRVRGDRTVPVGEWVHVTVTYDGSSRADGVALYLDGEPVPLEVIRDNLYSTIRYEGGDPALTLGARFRDYGFQDGQMDSLQVFERAVTPLEAKAIAQDETVETLIANLLDKEERTELRAYYRDVIDESYRDAAETLFEAREAEAQFAESVRQVMVMAEMDEPRQAFVLHRGDYKQRKDPVDPGVLDALNDFPGGAPPNRLGLAQWLTDPAHPLTARVAVNRMWAQVFGRGLVATPEDFGIQGDAPSHPELLDYLAQEFIASGWDQKAMLRRLVLSSAYRQASITTADVLRKDPENVLLARGPSYRRSAEEIRDTALASSGLLVRTIGGPSVKPYQPEGLWRDSSNVTYKADTGDALYRRSLYTFIKRTVPPPSMTTFDATNREVCVVERESTTTPLQALVLLNDPQFVEAARVLAERTLAGRRDGAIDAIFRTVLTREPMPAERDILDQLYAEQLDWFSQHPDEAESYLAVGEIPRDESLDPAESAAMTAVAQAIFNLDEFQVKR